MTRVYFKGGYLTNKESSRFDKVTAIAFVILFLLIFPGSLMFLMFLGLTIYFVVVILVPLVCLVALIVLARRVRETFKIEVRDNGLLLGGKLVEWKDIDDVKFWTESHEEIEAEGSPVMGYGMYGYGYGYVAPRSVNYKKYRYVVAQIYHKTGVDELYFKKGEFWKFIKAVLQVAKASISFPTEKNWLQKLKVLDKTM